MGAIEINLMPRASARRASPPCRAPTLVGLALTLLVLVISPWAAAPASPAVLAGPISGPTAPTYSFNVDVDYSSAIVQVEQTTTFRNPTGLPLDRVVFQVVSARSGAFRLGEATVDGRSVPASLDGSVLELPLPALLQPGGSAAVALSYRLDVPRRAGRLSAGPRYLGLGNWFPTLAPHRGDWDRHQFTEVGDAFVTEVADFDVRLTVSRPVIVASTGRVLEGDGTSFHLQALGVRDFGLSLSPHYVVAEAPAGSAIVRAYTFSAGRSRLYAGAAANFLVWYGARFTPYPYRVLALAEVDLPASYGGLEYPGLVFLSAGLGERTPFEGSATEMLIGHEVAHQWFYSLVGNDQVRDPWLDEAFATYLPFLYYRDTAPATFNALWNGLLTGLDDRVRAAGGQPVDTSVDDFFDDGPYFTVVYRQGARFLDELRQAMGDAGFEAALREEVDIFADKLASPRAVLDIFQRYSLANLNPIIGRYFSYKAFGDPGPSSWRLELPDNPWGGSAYLFVGADFPVSWIEVWIDGRRLYVGEQNALNLDLTDVEPGEYALLVRLWDHRGVQFERAHRVSVAL
jgi:hypothetical protein